MAKRQYTREERAYRKRRTVYLLFVVLWAVFVVGILFFDIPDSKSADIPITEEDPVVVQVIPEPDIDGDIEAVSMEYDPVRDDVPLDAETQRLLYEACGETGIRYELALAVIWQETDFRNVIGDGGESYGYMQVQPRWHGKRMEQLGVTDLSDPYGNFLVGCDYLAELVEKHDLTDALTKYNSGKTGDSQYARSVLNYMKILTTEDY